MGTSAIFSFPILCLICNNTFPYIFRHFLWNFHWILLASSLAICSLCRSALPATVCSAHHVGQGKPEPQQWLIMPKGVGMRSLHLKSLISQIMTVYCIDFKHKNKTYESTILESRICTLTQCSNCWCCTQKINSESQVPESQREPRHLSEC